MPCILFYKSDNKNSTTGSVNITSEDKLKFEQYIGKIDFVMRH